MTTHKFIKPSGNAIPFKVRYTLDNGLELSIIWANMFEMGDDDGAFFEAAIIFDGSIVSDEVFPGLDFQQVADLKTFLESFTKDKIKNMIAEETFYSTVSNFIYK